MSANRAAGLLRTAILLTSLFEGPVKVEYSYLGFGPDGRARGCMKERDPAIPPASFNETSARADGLLGSVASDGDIQLKLRSRSRWESENWRFGVVERLKYEASGCYSGSGS